MAPRRKQLLLFSFCAAVLLSAGYGWGYAISYARFYSVSSLMDRETLDLDFNSRLLHFANVKQPESVRARLTQRLSEEVHYADEMIATSDDKDVARDAAASLARARAALAGL